MVLGAPDPDIQRLFPISINRLEELKGGLAFGTLFDLLRPIFHHL
jgi:hypothetical protein